MSKFITDPVRAQKYGGYGDEATLTDEARSLGYGVWPGLEVIQAWIAAGGEWEESWWPDGKGDTVKYVCPVKAVYHPDGWNANKKEDSSDGSKDT